MKTLVLMTLAAVSAVAVAAETPAEKAAREAQNFNVLMQHYPARARAAGEQGAVGFKLTLDRDGEPTACAVTQSSGHALLDDETCDLLLLYARYQPDRDAKGNRIAMSHDGVINWRLSNTAPDMVMASSQLRTVQIDPMDKKICKKALRTGTLSGIERTCRTRREWEAETADMKRNWQEIQGSYGSTKCMPAPTRENPNSITC